MAKDIPVVRLTTPAEMVAAVPLLCGFVPAESVVAVSLRGPRKRIGLTMRLDLPPAEVEEEVADQLALRLSHDGASAALIVIYTDAPDGVLPRASLFDELRGSLRERDIDVNEALLVRRGRWSSYTCSSPRCCPREGTPLGPPPDTVQQIAAAQALDGHVVLPDRDALGASVAGPSFLAAAAWLQRLDAALVSWAADVQTKGTSAVRAASARELRRLLASTSDGATAADEVLARAVVSLQDVQVRDEVATWALSEGDELLRLLLSLARVSVSPYEVPVCTLIGLVAWTRGNGGLANVALDRALGSDPSYSMALLLREGLDAQIRPDQVRQWLRATRRAVVLSRRAG